MNKVESIGDKRATSERRKASARANGAKSKGPVTPEGKARSSRNAVTHGCLAALLTLSEEDEEILNRIHVQYVARFDPRDQVEHDLVQQIVYANFQMRQAWIRETATLGLQMSLDHEKVCQEWHNPPEHDRRALAFAESIKHARSIPLLQRYSRSLASQAERAIKLLTELRQQRLPPPPDAIAPEEADPDERNEPNPTIEHLDPAPRQVFAYALTRPTLFRTPTLPRPQKVMAAG